MGICGGEEDGWSTVRSSDHRTQTAGHDDRDDLLNLADDQKQPMLWKYSLKTYKGNFVALFPKIEVINIARIVNAVQCHSLLSGHYDCNVLMFSKVRNVNNFTTSLGLAFEGVL